MNFTFTPSGINTEVARLEQAPQDLEDLYATIDTTLPLKIFQLKLFTIH